MLTLAMAMLCCGQKIILDDLRMTPVPPIVRGTHDFQVDDLHPGDFVVLSGKHRMAKDRVEHSNEFIFECQCLNHNPYLLGSVEDLKDFKSLELFAAPFPKVSQNQPILLPNGGTARQLMEETLAVVLEVRQPDGILTDAPVLRISALEGLWKGKPLWVRTTSVLMPVPKQTAPRATSGVPSVVLFNQAEHLRLVGRPDLAEPLYRDVVKFYPKTKSAKIARQYLSNVTTPY